MEKSIKRRIGVLVVLGIFMAIVLSPTAVAPDPETLRTSNGDFRIDIDNNNNEGDRAFIVSHDAGTELFRVQEDGNVGIGLIPDRKLEILDTSNPQLKLTVSDSYWTEFQTTSSGYLYIHPSLGRVGIETSSPLATLHVYPTVVTTSDYYGIRGDMTFNPGIGIMTNWHGVYIAAPTITTGSITNKYALVTESGAGNVGIGTTSPSTTLHVDGDVAFGDGSELTISGGTVTATDSYHTIDTESNAISDDLDTINGGSVAGEILIIRAEHTDRTVVAKDGANLKLVSDFNMDNTEDTLTLIFDGSNWLEISRSDNGA